MYDQYLAQSQQQRLQLVLAPQLRQSLEFLQVPLLELRTLIQKELEQNPTLEERPDDHTPLEVEPGAPSPTDAEGELKFQEEYQKLTKLDDEWRDYFMQAGAARPYTADDEAKRQFFLDSLQQSETLQEHLIGQLGLVDLPEEDQQLATMLIGCINEDGYLNSTLGELAETSSSDPARLERLLKAIQDMDPIGIGARDLPECLLIQLVRLGKGESLEAQIVRGHLEALGTKHQEEIARALGVPLADIHRAARMIATLEPKPGRAFASDETMYAVPELTVQKLNGQYQILLNNERLPRVRISRQYRQLMEDPNTPKETRDYIRDKIRAGAFMIRSIHQRQQTLRNIATEIVKVQYDFFEHGLSHLRPLVMADIAKVMSIHETTVSRAISNKYMLTPRGMFEMKYFFTPGYRTAGGEPVSNKTVKDTLEQLVGDEDPARPLSDQEIVRRLAERGLQVARRTIAKYRDELKIPPSHLRKE